MMFPQYTSTLTLANLMREQAKTIQSGVAALSVVVCSSLFFIFIHIDNISTKFLHKAQATFFVSSLPAIASRFPFMSDL
jgi:hypothetical protein